MMMACVAIPTYSAYVPVPLFPSPFSSARASYFLDLDKAAGFWISMLPGQTCQSTSQVRSIVLLFFCLIIYFIYNIYM
jgi:hypothetical protein